MRPKTSGESDSPGELYVVLLEATESLEEVANLPDCHRLTENLFLIRSELTQSRLYHALKRWLKPDGLFVARVKGHPKFKGMEAGALKWLRAVPAAEG